MFSLWGRGREGGATISVHLWVVFNRRGILAKCNWFSLHCLFYPEAVLSYVYALYMYIDRDMSEGNNSCNNNNSNKQQVVFSSNNLKTQPPLPSSLFLLLLSLLALNSSWKCKWKWEWNRCWTGRAKELRQMFWHHTTVTYKSIWHGMAWHETTTCNMRLASCCCCCCQLSEIFPCAAMYNRPQQRGGREREIEREKEDTKKYSPCPWHAWLASKLRESERGQSAVKAL